MGNNDDQPLVLRSDGDHVATLTLNRPAARNALSEAMLTALAERLAEIDGDDEVHVVILAGAGPAFSAGHDLREIRADDDPAFHERLFARCSDVMMQVGHLRQPVIARVSGVATAAGCQLVASCDLAVAGATARFATPGVNIGLFCSTPMVALSRNVPRKKAMEMLLLGEAMSASDAALYGLVNRAVPWDAVMAEAFGMARKIASKSKATVATGKTAFYRQIEAPLGEAYTYAARVMVENMMAADAAEGICAFIEKRPPQWKGE